MFRHITLPSIRPGMIVVGWKQRIPIRKALMKFMNNECVVLIEGDEVKEKAAGEAAAT